MRLPELAGSWAKVDRAREQRREFDLAAQQWLDRKPHEFATEFEPDTGRHIIRLVAAPTVPLRVAAIVSDVIHNLRAALDYMVYRLAVLEARQDPPPLHTRLAFPIAKSAEEFERKERTSRGRLSDDIWVGLRAFQPFATHPDDPAESALSHLEEMDIVAKHRHLPLTTTVIGDRFAFLGTDPPGVDLTIYGLHHPGPLEDGAEFLTYGAATPGKVEVKFDTPFALAFGRAVGMPQGHRVGEVLNALDYNVETVLSAVTSQPLPDGAPGCS